jgi:hypothetical protein
MQLAAADLLETVGFKITMLMHLPNLVDVQSLCSSCGTVVTTERTALLDHVIVAHREEMNHQLLVTCQHCDWRYERPHYIFAINSHMTSTHGKEKSDPDDYDVSKHFDFTRKRMCSCCFICSRTTATCRPRQSAWWTSISARTSYRRRVISTSSIEHRRTRRKRQNRNLRRSRDRVISARLSDWYFYLLYDYCTFFHS